MKDGSRNKDCATCPWGLRCRSGGSDISFGFFANNCQRPQGIFKRIDVARNDKWNYFWYSPFVPVQLKLDILYGLFSTALQKTDGSLIRGYNKLKEVVGRANEEFREHGYLSKQALRRLERAYRGLVVFSRARGTAHGLKTVFNLDSGAEHILNIYSQLNKSKNLNGSVPIEYNLFKNHCDVAANSLVTGISLADSGFEAEVERQIGIIKEKLLTNG